MKELKKLFVLIPKLVLLFVFGGLMYMGVEILFRGYTHFSMFLVGGLCFVLVGGINEKLPWDMAFVSQMMIASLFVTAVEFIAGVILNIMLGLGVWDYSSLPYNLLGQISHGAGGIQADDDRSRVGMFLGIPGLSHLDKTGIEAFLHCPLLKNL